MTAPGRPRRVLLDDAFGVPLEHAALPSSDVVAGAPTTATLPFAEVGGTEVGLWEITAGTSRDTEVDEVFVVLSGEGTVRFEDGAAVELRAGVVVRLHAGERTEWEIRSTLRKVYLAT